MTVVTFPGQGSQKPGFLAPWLEDQASRTTLEQLSESSGIDLVAHGTQSDADTIRDTAVAQPLIVAAGILTWDALVARLGNRLDGVAVAGHSVGEIAAAYAAGIFDAATAMRFVVKRSGLMAKDAAAVTTGMSAVIGGSEGDVIQHLTNLDLSPANFNGAGQIVAAGEPTQLDALRLDPPAGARVIPLKVAGAFHTRWMADAQASLAAIEEEFAISKPIRPIHTNRDGSVVSDGATYRRYLVEQVNRPVHWDLCMTAFVEAGYTALIEAAPAGTLVGLAKRGMKGVPSAALNVPADIDAASELFPGA
ncbi:ACP S-malonyltransferase [Gulosibacter molinativorax]|uniref:[acyl-carrier-protein] S-malonyltransferase n=1 Tax=Gulosibacter molinativorax TaxID=256821 RepID=A0ABT7C3B1_9MICO|nr:ACP S-malonyltransferase [Gulosibacter molinativorax]MDJ1369772.1 ACP S-malonyltransferase [Gulosibacter molinativorax]QUY61737.1 Malonyl CoA-acyl carrier protein transacylase [Gulosibacter molinativorax]